MTLSPREESLRHNESQYRHWQDQLRHARDEGKRRAAQFWVDYYERQIAGDRAARGPQDRKIGRDGP